MKLSEERQNHLAHLVTDRIWNDDLVDYTDEDRAVRAAKVAVKKFVAEFAEIDQFAIDRVASLKRGVVEGSPEWEILYKKYFEEELQRRGK